MTAALALAAGSAATAPGERDGAWSIAAVTGAGALCAARGLPPVSGGTLLALAPVAAWRAAADPRADPRAAAPSWSDTPAAGACAGPSYTGALRQTGGTTTFGDERWRLGTDAPLLELPPGLARDGEPARVSAAARGVHPATSPFSDERSRRPLVLLPRADEVVRLGPAAGGSAAARRVLTTATERAGSEALDGRPISLLARVTGELVAARHRGLERIADAGRATAEGDDPVDADEDTGELELEFSPQGAASPGLALLDVPLPHAGLFAALLLGASEDVDFEVGEHFTRTGTRHIISLSGLHFSLVAWLIGRPLAVWVHALLRSIGAALGRLVAGMPGRSTPPLGVPGTARAHVRAAARALTSPGVLLAVGALAFLPIAGSAAPAARAAVALALASLADLVGRGAARGRRPDGLTLWSAALLLEVLARPAAALAVSVQLSYGATLALIVAFRPMFALLKALVPGGGRLAPVDGHGRRRAPVGRLPPARLRGAALGALAAGLVATLATLPITWARFGEWSPLGIVATPLVMPFVTGALAGGYAWLLAPDLAPLALPAWSLELLVRTLAWLDTLPTTPLVLPVVSTDWLVLSTPAALGALVFAGQRTEHVTATGRAPGAVDVALRRSLRARWLAVVAASLAVLAPMRRSAQGPHGLEFVACDVGRGRAFLLRAPGLGVWLIDGGSSDRSGVARRALLPALRAWGAHTIGVVLTSESRAHGSALPWLAERFHVHTWAGAAPETVGVPAPHANSGLRLDVEDGAAGVRSADPGCALTLVRARGSARTLVVHAGDHTLWILGEGAEGTVDELLVRGLLTRAEPGGPRAPRGAADSAGQRLLIWPSSGVGRASGAVLDSLAPRMVWFLPPGPVELGAELERRAVSSAALASRRGLALALDLPPLTGAGQASGATDVMAR